MTVRLVQLSEVSCVELRAQMLLVVQSLPCTTMYLTL